jgi:hypothetical protein
MKRIDLQKMPVEEAAALLDAAWDISMFQPPSIPGNILWLRSDDPNIVLNGSDVNTWPDQSTLGTTDVVQVVAANQPAFSISGGVGGLPKLVFDGTQNHYLEGPAINSLIASTPFHMIAVSTSANVLGERGIVGAQAAAPRMYGHAQAASYLDSNNLTYAQNTSLAVRHWLHDGTDFKYRENAVQLDSVTVALSALTGAMFTVGWTGGQYLTGDIYEVIMYDQALTAWELEVVESYLCARYNL